jgi:[ribosomal protein S18]-alanine N-acetyltransferase
VTGDLTVVEHDISIRPARKDDLDELWALDVKVFERLAYPYFVLRQFFDLLSGCWLVAEHASGDLVGYSLAAPATDRTVGWVLGLAVAPDHRNLGYGRRLTVESVNLLRTMGLAKVCLTVEPENEYAVRLYHNIGFVDVELRRDYLGAGEDRVLMACELSATAGAIPRPRPFPTTD